MVKVKDMNISFDYKPGDFTFIGGEIVLHFYVKIFSELSSDSVRMTARFPQKAIPIHRMGWIPAWVISA